MANKKSLKTEGLFSMADRFVADFFEQLKKGAADQIIKKAENAKLPPAAIKAMKEMDDRSEELKRIVRELSK